MRRLPIRVRLAAVFAAAMVAVLAVAGTFVYLGLRDDLDETVDTGLAARADAVAALAGQAGAGLGGSGAASIGEAEETFAQVLTPAGAVVAAGGGARGAALPARLRAVAARGPLVAELAVPGIEGTARLLARPAPAGDRIVVVGQSLSDRDEALAGLAGSFAIGGPVAALVASLLGYALAGAALAPVEAMRRRAAAVSLSREGERLPLPEARDEIRRLGETLNEMLERLWRSFERERRFVADASHELRTPVAVLKTELETLLRAGDHPPQVRDALAAAVAEADHLAALAEDLLVLARAAGDGLAVRAEALDAGRLLGAVRDRFSDRAGAAGRRVAVDVPAGLLVHADPMRLRQAVGNLADNALRHGAGEVTLAARPAGGGVELDVADAGPGFPAGFAERAFERFARGDEARTRGGAGLGLAIVRAVAEAHGGWARIVSGPGEGGRVRLWLPGGQEGDAPRGSQAGFSAAPHHAGRNVEPTNGGAR